MQIDLRGLHFEKPELPQGVRLHPWSYRVLEAHAEAKFRSFRNELDATVFPALADADGCLKLMKEISCRQDFIPESTWLLTVKDPVTGRKQNCGTVQGIQEKRGVGAIQNIGIVENQRSQGLGSILMQTCLHGFQLAGNDFVKLEVTAQNTAAIRLYERIGFRKLRTVYKSAEIDAF